MNFNISTQLKGNTIFITLLIIKSVVVKTVCSSFIVEITNKYYYEYM